MTTQYVSELNKFVLFYTESDGIQKSHLSVHKLIAKSYPNLWTVLEFDNFYNYELIPVFESDIEYLINIDDSYFCCIDKLHYAYIGMYFQEFATLSRSIKFRTIIDNGYSHPYVFDKLENCYFINERIRISQINNKMTEHETEDLVELFELVDEKEYYEVTRIINEFDYSMLANNAEVDFDPWENVAEEWENINPQWMDDPDAVEDAVEQPFINNPADWEDIGVWNQEQDFDNGEPVEVSNNNIKSDSPTKNASPRSLSL